MTQHTPGPWTVDDATQEGAAALTVRSSNRFVADVRYTDRDRGASLANARLIAAAPMLLEALVEAEAVINSMPEYYGFEFDVLKSIRAAIRAAKGETNG